MVDLSLPARVVLTAGFVGTGLFCVRRCVGSTPPLSWAARIDYGAHALMSVSMVAMAWATSPLVSWQIALFTLAACWFLLRATAPTLSTASTAMAAAGAGRPHPTVAGRPAEHPAGATLRCVHHAAVMAAMAWTVSVMATGSRPAHDMLVHGASPSGMRYVAAVGAGYCLCVAGLIAAGTRAGPLAASGHGGVAGELNHALMTAGMAVMLLAMW